LATALVLASCASGTPQTTSADAASGPVDGGDLVFAIANDPISLNPSGTGSGNDTWYVTRQLVDSLLYQDPKTSELEPWLAKSYTANVEPVGLGQVVGRIRNAIRRGFSAEGLNVEVLGKQRPVDVRVAAPVVVSGTVRGGAGNRRFHAVLDGVHRVELRVFVPGPGPAELSMRVRTSSVTDRVRPTQSAQAQLANTIDLELSYARKRQYDQFLSGADPTGKSSTIYVYRTAPRAVAAAPIESSGSRGNTMGWIALGLLLAAGLPLAAVVWARS
jgi:hypothetical protein